MKNLNINFQFFQLLHLSNYNNQLDFLANNEITKNSLPLEVDHGHRPSEF